MLQERMAESLVLLAHLLCVPLKDVVALKVNARFEGKKVIKTLKSAIVGILTLPTFKY